MTGDGTSVEDVAVHVGRRSGLDIVVAVDSTLLGPALGGCRVQRYPTQDAGRRDAARLASAMTVKAALAGLSNGGGKVVVVLPEGEPALDVQQRRQLLLDVGDLVEAQCGHYLVGPDVGTGPADMDVIGERTAHVLCRTERAGGSGDSAPATALGTYSCMRVVRESLTGSSSLADARVGVIGLGSVGGRLARMLADDGAELVVADIDASRRTVAERVGAEWRHPDVVPTLELDILVPAGTGALIGPDLVDRLRCGAVVGPANNQLTDDRVADGLHRRGVLWAPDYVVGAGGIVNAVARERAVVPATEAEARVRAIATTLRSVLDDAAQQDRAPHRVAAEHARKRLDAAAAARSAGHLTATRNSYHS
ncbi:MAG TPA: Glu/Leu/Phe/Val dehydrogenase dimerization domain-containing protein [Pseudonocardia sp.]